MMDRGSKAGGGDTNVESGRRGGGRRGGMSLAGWVVTALVSTLSLGLAGASGCGDTIDSKGASEPAAPGEALGQAEQAAAVTPIKCTSINLANGAHNRDSMIALEKPNDNYGASSFAFVSGGTGTNPALPQQALFKFDFSAIPAGATILNAGLALNQTNTGVATLNVHKITGVWGNHEGSMLLWVLILALFGAMVAAFGNNLPRSLRALVLAVQGWVVGDPQEGGVRSGDGVEFG